MSHLPETYGYPVVSVCPDDPPWTAAPPDWLEQQAWFLAALDKKFAEQEAVIRELLDPGLDIQGYDSYDVPAIQVIPDPQEHDASVELEEEDEEDEGGTTPVDYSTADQRTRDSAIRKHLRRSENIRKATAVLGAKVMNESIAPERPIKTFVKKRLDGYMGAVVAANIGMMILMTQWAGGNANFALNEASEPWPWFTQGLFDGCEYVFYSLYLMDVLLRAFVLRREWCYDAVDGIQFMNMFDAFLVLISTGELIILPALFSGGTDLQTDAVRLLKLVRIVRTLRIIKAVSAFRQLRVLVATCLASIGALIWSMILLVVLKVAVSLMAGQALQTFILDENEDLDARIEMNTLYGSFTKSFYTFFEITHSGSWPSRVRPVLEKVSPWYSIIFLPYIALVVFAVIRVVTALFIKETLASAANDAEMVIEESRRMALEYQARLEELFHLVDYDGDGHLSAEEFVQAMELPSVQQYLKFLEVTVRDCRPLFEILAEGDGRITIAEFCKGLMQIKGQARALDIVVLQHENSKMMEQNHEILTILRAFSRKSRTARGSSAECSQRLHGSESSSRLSLPTSENAVSPIS